MLKEERIVREWVRAGCKAEGITYKWISRDITALVRAVREDDAATIETACKKKTLDDKVCRICAESAAAIRSKK